MPNRPDTIIWITTDHMRYDNVGAHGFPVMHTPNIDRLVQNGVSFRNCYVNNPICMPSRCSFMTGCYPQATGVNCNGQELRPDFEPVLPQIMKDAGYHTSQIGKLHFQCHEDHDLDPRARYDYGFDVFQLSEEPGCYEDAYRTWLRGEHPEWVNTFTVPRPSSDERAVEFRNFKVLNAPWQCSHAGWVAEQARRRILAGNAGTGPRFMHLGFYAPHPPLNPTREMFAPYADAEMPPPLRHPDDPRDTAQFSEDDLREYKRHFCATVTGVDLALGSILETLEKLGQLDNTLIMFGSDHGDACGDHGRVAKGPTYFEGIIRVPWILHWPTGLGTEPRAVEELVEMVDVLPTLTGLAGHPGHPAFQGRSYAEALRDREPVPGREDVYGFHGEGDIYLRNDRWKYLSYLREDSVEECLFDLAEDPGEFFNLANSPDHRDTLHEMRLRALQRSILASVTRQPRRLRF